MNHHWWKDIHLWFDHTDALIFEWVYHTQHLRCYWWEFWKLNTFCLCPMKMHLHLVVYLQSNKELLSTNAVYFNETSFLFLSSELEEPWRSRLVSCYFGLCVNVSCSVSTSTKLCLSCFAVTESTAHDCLLRGLSINHTDCVRLCVCECVHACVTSLLFTSHHRIWRTFILPSWPRKCQWPH